MKKFLVAVATKASFGPRLTFKIYEVDALNSLGAKREAWANFRDILETDRCLKKRLEDAKVTISDLCVADAVEL